MKAMTHDRLYITYIYKATLVIDILLLIYITIVCLMYINVKYTNPELLIYNNQSEYLGKPYRCYDLSQIDCNKIGGWVYPSYPYIKNTNKFLYYNITNANKLAIPMYIYIILSRGFIFWRKKNAISS